MNSDEVFAAVVASVIWFVITCIAVVGTVNHMQESAVKAGVAEYTINPQTGETKFVWKTHKARLILA